MNKNYCNIKWKIENFDLKKIYLKHKDLSKIFQKQSHPIEHPSRQRGRSDYMAKLSMAKLIRK